MAQIDYSKRYVNDLIVTVHVKIDASAWFATPTPTRGGSPPTPRRMPSPTTPLTASQQAVCCLLSQSETIYSIHMS
jgi:hypothetical protein